MIVPIVERKDREGYHPEEPSEYRQSFIDRYGRSIGEAYYRYDRNYFDPEQQEARTAFADAIVTALEAGDHHQKVQAITALLDAMEQRDYFVHEDAQRAQPPELLDQQ